MDGSIPPQVIDLEFMQALQEENLNFALILTKTDKVNQKTLQENLKLFKQALQKQLGYLPERFLSSTIKKQGREKILEKIDEYLTIS